MLGTSGSLCFVKNRFHVQFQEVVGGKLLNNLHANHIRGVRIYSVSDVYYFLVSVEGIILLAHFENEIRTSPVARWTYSEWNMCQKLWTFFQCYSIRIQRKGIVTSYYILQSILMLDEGMCYQKREEEMKIVHIRFLFYNNKRDMCHQNKLYFTDTASLAF